jgi:outer membrane lipoprotein-sorting protein
MAGALQRFRVAAAALLLAAGAASGTESASPDAGEIVRRHIEAIGGKARWHSVQTLLVRGNASFASFTWVWKSPSKMRTEERDTTYTQKTVITAFDGSTGWIINPFKGEAAPRRLAPEELRRWQNNFLIRSDLLDLPDRGVDLRLLGRERVGERDAYKLSLRRDGRDDVLLWIDAQSFLLVQRARRVQAPWGGEQTITTPLSDYRQVEGLLIPHTIGPTRCAVEVNPEIGDELFDPPQPLR